MEEELFEILKSARSEGANEEQLQLIVDRFNAKKKSPESVSVLDSENGVSDISPTTPDISSESPNQNLDIPLSPLYKEYQSAIQLTPEQEADIEQELLDQKEPSLWDQFRGSQASRLLGLPPKEFTPGTKTKEDFQKQFIEKNKEEFFEELSKDQLNQLAQEEYSKIESLNKKNQKRIVENDSLAEQLLKLEKEAGNISEGFRLAKEKGDELTESGIDNANQRISEILLEGENTEKQMRQNILEYENSQEDLQDFNSELQLFKKNWGAWENAKDIARLTGARIINGFSRTNLGVGIEGNDPDSDDVFDSGEFLEEIERQEAFLKPKERVESIRKLNSLDGLEDFGEFVLESFSEQAPILGTVLTPGGISVIGASEFANKKQELEVENQEEGTNYDPDKILMASAASAFFETIGAAVDRFAITRGARALKAGIAGGGEQAIKNGAKKYLAPITAELGEETAALIGNQVIDKYYLDKPNVEIGEDFLNTIAKTGVTVGMINTIPTLVGDALGAYHTKKNKKRLRANLESVKELKQQLDNSNLSQTEIKAIESKISGIVAENTGILESAVGLVNKLSTEEKSEIARLQDNINEQNRSIDEIQASKNLSEKAKAELINDLKEDVNENETQKEEILNPSNSTTLENNTEFDPLESEGESIGKLLQSVNDGKTIEEVAKEHTDSYLKYLGREGVGQEILDSDFVRNFEKGVVDALNNPDGFDPKQERKAENGSRVDENGNPISEVDFLTKEGRLERPKETDALTKLEKERDAEIAKLEKPNIEFDFLNVEDLVNSKNPVQNKEVHDDISDRYNKLKALIECL